MTSIKLMKQATIISAFCALSLIASSEVLAAAKKPRTLTRAEKQCVATLSNVTCGKAFSCGTAKQGVTFNSCTTTLSKSLKKSLRSLSARKGLAQCTKATNTIAALTCADISSGGGTGSGGKK